MKNRILRLLFAVAATSCLLGLTAGTAMAVNNKFTGTVPVLVQDPDDLHVTFTGTGGSIANVTVTPAPATVGVSGGGNTIDVTWNAKLPAGTVVVIRFTTTFGGVKSNNGRWTNGGVDIPGGDFGQGGSNQIPGASPFVMALIAMAVAAGGIQMLRRRAEA